MCIHIYASMDTYIQFWVCSLECIHSHEYMCIFVCVCVCVCVLFWPLSDSSDLLEAAGSRAPSPL